MNVRDLGDSGVQVTREDEHLIAEIAKYTRMSVAGVRRRLSGAHGRKLVRNVFEREWPAAFEELGLLPVRDVRTPELVGAIAEVTALSAKRVRTKLGAAGPTTDLRTLFADCWPNAEGASAKDVGEVSTLNAIEVGLTPRICVLTGLPEKIVWRRLRRAHGRTLVRNVFEEEWPTGQPAARAPSAASLLCRRYRLGDKLGEGGFGEVWAATDFGASRPGLRVLKFAHGPYGKRSLRVEAERLSDLAHPNICRLYRVEKHATKGEFLVFQHGGDSLADRLMKGNYRPSAEDSMHVATMVASALDYAHANNILHLDISPGNILVDDKGEVRVTDFGISKRASAVERDGTHTLIGGSTALFGSPGYTAPEIWAHGEGRSSSDQYSLALVLCSLLEGRVFDGRGYKLKAFAKLTASQNAAIRRAASLEPRSRFKSCGAFAEALRG